MERNDQLTVEALSKQLDEIRQHIMVSLKEVRETVNTLEITHKKRTELEDALHFSEARNRAILDTAVDGIISIDEHGRIEVFNKAAEHIFGYSAHEAVGKNVAMLMPEPHASKHTDYIRNYLQTGNARIIGFGREVEGRRKDGSLVPLSLAVSELKVGERLMFTGIVRDLTRIKELEREKADFYAMLSHDMKSPLVNVIGFSELFLETKKAQIDNEGLEMLEAIKRSGHRLLDMIDKMLIISRLESSPDVLSKSSEKIAPLVIEAIDDAAHKSRQAGVRLDAVVDNDIPDAVIDKSAVRRALGNLIDNAVKFSSRGDTVTVSASLIDHQGSGYIVFSVADTGPGIPADNRNHVFNKHFCTRPSAGPKGCGLGLAVVKSVADAHKGRVELETEEGKGSVFRMLLPVNSS